MDKKFKQPSSGDKEMKQLTIFTKFSEKAKEEFPFKRVRMEEFDFKEIQASSFVYGIHPYPAMFHFMLVRELLQTYSKPKDTILDPFMGSGVVCVESIISGRRFIGYDINPLAVLITKVRSTPLEYKSTFSIVDEIIRRAKKVKPFIPNFNNIDYWFTEKTKEDLAKLLAVIKKVKSIKIKNFLKVSFSETVRRVSNIKFNEFKLLRRKDYAIEERDAFRNFRTIALRNLGYIKRAYEKYLPSGRYEIKTFNVTNRIPLRSQSVDLVITSPPYGDSRTTVAYGQFSRLPLQWLGLRELVDKESLGSKIREIEEGLPSEILYECLKTISEQNEKRAKEVFSFYYDLYKSIQEIGRVVKSDGTVCFVVGNRRVKGIDLPTDKISTDFFESIGFHHEITYIREISNKRMPLENSPSNVQGMKDRTMKYEYIVICRRKGGNI